MIVFAVRGTEYSVAKYLECHLLLKQLLLFFFSYVDEGDFSFVAKKLTGKFWKIKNYRCN